MEHPLYQVEEKILIRLNVRDLVRCKCVCTSWSSLISCPRFIKDHLKYHYDIDRKNEGIGHQRVTMCKPIYLMRKCYETDRKFFEPNDRHLLGSVNGLVCVSPFPTKILVINPSTREVEKVAKPQIPKTDSLCWGFGYKPSTDDKSSTDDYKLLLGFKRGENCTSFQVFSLRSNSWKDIGEVNYLFISTVGIFCNGALHWLAYNTIPGYKNVILSFQFSDEKFLEFPEYIGELASMRLGTMEDRLCLFRHELSVQEVWVLKDYSKKQCWVMFGWECEIKFNIVHLIKQLKHYIPNRSSFFHEPWARENWLCKNQVFFGTPSYVESLVSPHFHSKPQRKRRATVPITGPKVKENRNAIAWGVPGACEIASTSTSSGN